LEDGCHPDEANALKAYIRKHTTPQKAFKAIAHTMLESEDPRGDMWRVWSLVMSAFIKLPSEYIAEMINFLLVIQDLSEPELERADEKKNKLLGPIWRGLGFGHIWSDHYKSDS
jgi:predicted Zn-dependent protease with MMP-like domain